MTRILNIRSRHAPVKKNFYSSHFNTSRYQSKMSGGVPEEGGVSHTKRRSTRLGRQRSEPGLCQVLLDSLGARPSSLAPRLTMDLSGHGNRGGFFWVVSRTSYL